MWYIIRRMFVGECSWTVSSWRVHGMSGNIAVLLTSAGWCTMNMNWDWDWNTLMPTFGHCIAFCIFFYSHIPALWYASSNYFFSTVESELCQHRMVQMVWLGKMTNQLQEAAKISSKKLQDPLWLLINSYSSSLACRRKAMLSPDLTHTLVSIRKDWSDKFIKFPEKLLVWTYQKVQESSL